MTGESKKIYQVEYQISMRDDASKMLEALAIKAQDIATPLASVSENITQVRDTIKKFRQDENLAALTIRPNIDTTTINEQFTTLQNKAKTVADNIARLMNNAFAGVGTKVKKEPQTKREIEKEIAELDKRIKVSTGAALKQAKEEHERLARKLNKAPTTIDTQEKSLKSFSAIAQQSSKLNTAADAIGKINENISKLNGSKNYSIKIDADITSAVTKINTLLETIRTNVAALPITVTEAGKTTTKGGKAISTKTGKATKVGTANSKAASKGSLSAIENVLKGKNSAPKAVVDVIPTPNGNALTTQLIQSKEKLQAEAAKTPIVLRGSFNGGDAGFQLRQSIAKLNELAKTNPVVIRGSFNGGDAGFQLRQSIANLQELANSSPIIVKSTSSTQSSDKGTNKNKPYATQAQIAMYEKHQAEMSKLRLDRAALDIKDKYKRIATEQAAKQAELESVWKPIDPNKPTESKLGNAQPSVSRRIPFNNRAISELSNKAPSVVPGTTTRTKANGGRIGSVTANSPNSAYNRMRQFWYPFTGNTSFGARTPIAVDMAKGMGTMFAIGGAMSAIGSSLSQSVHYQNIMKTTQAILENGTSNYSDSGFKNMEQVVRQVGKETKFTAPQVASAAKFLAMAGYDIPSIKSAINPVANIALIGDTNLGETADKLTNVMTTFGIAPEKMSDIADIMTSTFTRSNTDMMMLAESAKYAGGIAHLYGGNFQNNFSDVMAMFGALGNAGIQASSAGTTLRMMYQNLMQPNKNQKKTLEHYGITTRDASGAPLEMVAILKQISEKVPEGQLADAVGNMFRITAQPGAAALVQAISKDASGKSKLVELMEANRAAAGTGVAQSIADEKKNTLQGLWAQVESTFTEGVLQALENREGGWAGQLMRLRDYLAKPETVKMLSSIVDMVEQLIKTMATFANVYAKLYSMFPGLINGWMHVQLLFTQLGYLATPIIQLMSILNRFGIGSLGAKGAAAATGATGAAATALAGGVASKGSQSIANNRAVYEAGMAYWLGKKNVAKDIANRHGGKALSMLRNITPGEYWAIAATNPELAALIGQSPTLAIKEYSEKYPNSAIAQEYAKAQYLKQLRNIRRPSQFTNPALLDRYIAMSGNTALAMSGNAALIAEARQARGKILASDNAAFASGEMSRGEYMQRNGFKRTAGMTWKNSFSSGKALGTLSAASMLGGLKNMALSLLSGLAKAIGLLVSPVGLAVAGLSALGGGLYYVYNRIQKYHENLKLADESSKWMGNANYGVYKNYIQTGVETGGFKPVEIGYAKKEEDEDIASYRISNTVADTLADKDNVYGLTGSEILSKYASGFEFLPKSYINDYKKTHQDYDISASYNLYGGQVSASRTINDKAVEDARKLGMIALWGEEASKQKGIVQAMKDLQEAMKNGNAKRVQDILNAYKPTSQTYMANLKDAEAIQKIADPTKYREWQEIQYNILDKLVKEQQSPFLHYKNAMDLIEQYKGLTKKERNDYDVSQLGQTLIQSIPIAFNGTTASISLDKMGRIDWTKLAESVNNSIPFTVSQQQEILSNVYDAIYNDPNIKSCTSIIDLLKTYLPQIANQTNPYDEGGRFETWGEANETNNKNNVTEENSLGILARPKNNFELPKFDFSTPNLPQWKTDLDRTPGDGLMEKTANYKEKYPERFPQTTSSPSVNNSIKNLNNTGGRFDPSGDKKQKDYASTYGRNAAKPTQVIINIDNLARFDRTAIAGNSDERAIANAIETKIAEAVSMLSAQILTTASSTISQGV